MLLCERKDVQGARDVCGDELARRDVRVRDRNQRREMKDDLGALDDVRDEEGVADVACDDLEPPGDVDYAVGSNELQTPRVSDADGPTGKARTS